MEAIIVKLNKLQQLFTQALRYKNTLISREIQGKQALSSDDLLQLYRNNFVIGVSEALAATYPHTLALVGEDFFNSVAREFILQQPPQENNIISYGDGFSAYLHTLPQLQSLPYIAEMARFEWLLEQTTNLYQENKQLDIERLAAVPEQQFAAIRLQLPSQVSLFHSEQNIQRLYQMMVNNSIQETDLNQACYMALKKHADFRIELIPLTQDEFVLLQKIHQQCALSEITASNLQPFLPELIEKGLINDFTIEENV